MSWRPTATRAALALRAELLARTRAFFSERGVLEVETPALSAAAPTDPHIHALSTSVTGAGTRWLQTSPEFPMKRLLAAGYGDCWQLARVFRDGEAGAMHRTEFTLLEWYRAGWDDRHLIGEVDALVRALLGDRVPLGPARATRYEEVFERETGVPFAAAGPEACARIVAAAGIAPPDRLALAEWHDLVMGAVIAPRLGRGAPEFVTDFPVEQAALARAREADPRWSGRFEAFVDGIELANGYHELADAAEQRARFERDNAARAEAGRARMPLDERLLAALAHGLPECAGVAVGFDRVVMLALGTRDIVEVLAFGDG